jgi:RNA polymerase sigma-70 factor, ECF subfamily
VRRTDLEPQSDEQLLALYIGGELTAMEVLLERHEKPLFNFVLRQIGDRARAEDLLQETFLRLVEHAGTFEGHARLRTWLFRIARNQCIDEGRKRVHRRHPSLDAAQGADGEGATLYDRIGEKGPSAERSTVSKEVGAAMSTAISALPEEQREVFLLRQAQQLSFKEISEITGVTENTVKSRMRYALERLQAALAEYRDYAEELR